MNKARSTRKQSATATPAITLAPTPATTPASDFDGADFIEHILVEHGQFLTLLDATRQRLQAFLDGDTTLGAIERLTDEIAKALPATVPATALATAPTSLVGGAK